jgi:hypothetical protein
LLCNSQIIPREARGWARRSHVPSPPVDGVVAPHRRLSLLQPQPSLCSLPLLDPARTLTTVTVSQFDVPADLALKQMLRPTSTATFCPAACPAACTEPPDSPPRSTPSPLPLPTPQCILRLVGTPARVSHHPAAPPGAAAGPCSGRAEPVTGHIQPQKLMCAVAAGGAGTRRRQRHS